MQLSLDELTMRHTRCRALMETLAPEAGGILVFNRVSIYYLSGSLCNGVFWLPKEGAPVLMVKKSFERAKDESPLANVAPYRSYKDIPGILEGFGFALPSVVAAEQWSLPWAMADLLQKSLSTVRFVSADALLARLRSVKSPYELEILREAGIRHNRVLTELLPRLIQPGMSEWDIARIAVQTYLSEGHAGVSRLQGYGEESFGGTVVTGKNALIPGHNSFSHGYQGLHPAAPFLGDAGSAWEKGSLLALDIAFVWQGYHSDITQIYFAGREADIPEAVRKAQEACQAVELAVAAEMLPGALPSRLYERSLEIAAEAGFSEGFMGLGNNRVAFLGHGVGLFQDEWPALARRFDDPMEEGMTIAMEPKIALPEHGMAGTENTWEITKTGARSLTGPPREIICIG